MILPEAARFRRARAVPALAVVVSIACLCASAAAWSATAREAGTGLDLPALEALQQTRDRPLFTPARRPPVVAPVAPPPPPAPPPAPVVQAPPPPPPPDQIILTGIVLGQDARVAVLRNARTSEITTPP